MPLARLVIMGTLTLLLVRCGEDPEATSPHDASVTADAEVLQAETAASDGTAEATLVDIVPIDAMDHADLETSGESLEVSPEIADVAPETVDEIFPSPLPGSLPFVLTRPPVGEPLSEEEIHAFTVAITGLWKKTDYFTWVLETSVGMDESTGLPDYLVWWNGVDAVKEGDTVTFAHASGSGHNIWIPSSRILSQAAAGYLLTGDETMGEVLEQYAKGLVAMCEGMVLDADDPVHHLMARNITNQNHAFDLPSGKHKAVDYSAWESEYVKWNAQRFEYPSNPTWGPVWVTNTRSKDDVPHIYMAGAWLSFVADHAPEGAPKEAAAMALDYLEAFAGDIVDNGYHIRTKGPDGVPHIPDDDLASFVDYEQLIPNAECNPKLVSALLGYGEPLDNDCLLGFGGDYETIATSNHFFNYAIINFFHLSAAYHTLMGGYDAMAQALVQGYVVRLDEYQDDETWEAGKDNPRWDQDVAMLALYGAAVGVPMTAHEVRQVHSFYAQAIEDYYDWPNWDMWDPSVPDGTYDNGSGYRPSHTDLNVRIEEIAMFLVYCASPYRNPTGQVPVDCEIVADPSRWGVD